jgi:hypothetical protein
MTECVAESCQATDRSFCVIARISTPTTFLKISENSVITCAGQSTSFFTSSDDPFALHLIIVVSLNATANFGSSHASAFHVGLRTRFQCEFCRVYSNSPASVITLDDHSGSEGYRCLEFYNNSADSSLHTAYKGMISARSDCEFRSCSFIANTIDALVGCHAGTATVTFSRCIFDTLPKLAMQDAVAETASCTVNPAASTDVSVLCSLDLCDAYVCTSKCTGIVAISGCIFEGLVSESGNGGGAIYLIGLEGAFHLSFSQFISCFHFYSGGAILFTGDYVFVMGFVGRRCSAQWASFWEISLFADGSDFSRVNESSGFDGACHANTFAIGCNELAPVLSYRIHSLNSTFNFASSMGSGHAIESRKTVDLSFCRFHSNRPSNTVYFYRARLDEVHSCLEFYNNSVDSPVDAEVRGFLWLMSNCTFHGCVFIGNTIDFFFGACRVVVLRDCIFDVLPVLMTLDWRPQTASCIVDPDITVGVVPEPCDLWFSTDSFTVPIRSRRGAILRLMFYSLFMPFAI